MGISFKILFSQGTFRLRTMARLGLSVTSGTVHAALSQMGWTMAHVSLLSQRSLAQEVPNGVTLHVSLMEDLAVVHSSQPVNRTGLQIEAAHL